MTFFPDPLKPSEGPKDKHIIVDPIEKEKKDKSNRLGLSFFKEKKESIIYSALLTLVNKFSSLFQRTKTSANQEEHELVSALRKFIDLLNMLKKSDQSQNANFAQQLSEAWNFIELYIKAAKRTHLPVPIHLKQVESCLVRIRNYPPQEEHSLGFYLTHHAGQAWLPLPFIELLKQLHFEHQQDENHSFLAQWTEILETGIF